MANDKKMVEAITSMDVDFAQWYTDVVKKAELCLSLIHISPPPLFASSAGNTRLDDRINKEKRKKQWQRRN